MEMMAAMLRDSYLSPAVGSRGKQREGGEKKDTELRQMMKQVRGCRQYHSLAPEPPVTLWCVYQYNDYQDEDFYTLWGLFTSAERAQAARDLAIWHFKHRDFIRELPYVPVFRRSPAVRIAQGVWNGRENTSFFISNEVRILDRLQCATYRGEELLLEKYSEEFQTIVRTVLELHDTRAEDTLFSWLPREIVLEILGVLSRCVEYRVYSGKVHVLMHLFFGGQAGSQTCSVIDVYGDKKEAVRMLRKLRGDSRNATVHWFDLHTVTLDHLGQSETDIDTIL